MPEKDLVFYPHKQIAKSPLEENAYSQCVNVSSNRGLAGVNFASEALSITYDTSFTFTVNLGYIVIDTNNNWITGTPIMVSSAGTLPAGLSASTVYYLRANTAGTFYLHSSFDGAQNNTGLVSWGDAGTGVHTATVINLKKVMQVDFGFIMDEEGNVWRDDNYPALKLVAKGITGGNAGHGLKRYGLYIYLFRAELDRYQFVTQTLDTSFQTDQITTSIHSIDDDTLYMGYGSNIASYDGSTYNATALDLPTNVSISALAEIGAYLVIGTDQNKLYLWDKNFTTFETPINLPGGVKMLIPINNLVYVVLDNGDIYVTNGTSASQVAEFPKHILNNKEYPSFIFSPNGYRVEDNSILIAFGSTDNVSPIGIYELDLRTNEFKLSHISSSGQIGGDDTKVEITCISLGTAAYFGWQTYNTTDGYTYGLDVISTTDRYPQAVVYSPFYKLGTNRLPATVRHFDISLAEKLRTGQSVSLYYRTDLSGNFVLIGTFDDVSKISTTLDKAITVESLQIKMEINTNEDTYSPYVREVRIYG